MVKLSHTDIVPEDDVVDVIDDIHCPRFEVNSYKTINENGIRQDN